MGPFAHPVSCIVLIIIALLSLASVLSSEVRGRWPIGVGCGNTFKGRVTPCLFAEGVAEVSVFAILIIIFYNKQSSRQ